MCKDTEVGKRVARMRNWRRCMARAGSSGAEWHKVRFGRSAGAGTWLVDHVKVFAFILRAMGSH